MSESRTPRLLDVVALLADVPEAGLRRGQVGTVVDEVDAATVMVECTDPDGRAYAIAAVPVELLLVLRYEVVAA